MIAEIKTLDDVKTFTKQLVEEGTNVHPDEDFNNYVNVETGADTYTPDEALLRNTLMEQSFAICKKLNEDIYNIMQEIFLIETGLDKFIPLPSQEYNPEQ
jgi:hypothetical protein